MTRPVDLLTATTLTDAQLRRLSKTARRRLLAEVIDVLREDRRRNQLRYYEPANPDAMAVHLSSARVIGVVGGKRSTKTDTLLAEAAIQMTGVIPQCLEGRYLATKLRPPPIRVRLVVTSLTNAWDVNLKQKLQWFEWNGKLNEDGLIGDPRKGHWGWIPQRFLKEGDWAKSWSEKHRQLTLTNGSTLTVMSWEQELQEFEQGAFHLILEDELGPEDRHRANLTRVLDYGGQVLIGGTPSDDYAASVNEAWFHDQVYQPGLAGSNPRDVWAITLWTERNRTLDPEDIAWLEKGLTPDQREARLHGKFLHLAGLILPGFTEHPRMWCFGCRAPLLLVEGACPACGRRDAVEYCHVWGDEEMGWPGPQDWPVLFYMDPHQSRPTACAWFRVDRHDAVWQVAELEVQGDALAVKTAIEAFEREHALHPLWRKGDPKIGIQPNQFAEEVAGETFTIKRAFEDVGFFYEDANTNFTVARERLLQWFQPDPYTRQPKLRIHRACTRTIYQVTHFVWEQSRRFGTTAEKPGKKDSDFPALLRYCANDDPDWRGLERVRRPEAVVIGAGGTGRNKRVGW